MSICWFSQRWANLPPAKHSLKRPVFRVGLPNVAQNNSLLASVSAPSTVSPNVVDGRRSDTEMTLHVGFGWSLVEEACIDIDEGQIVALLLGEAMRAGAARRAS